MSFNPLNEFNVRKSPQGDVFSHNDDSPLSEFFASPKPKPPVKTTPEEAMISGGLFSPSMGVFGLDWLDIGKGAVEGAGQTLSSSLSPPPSEGGIPSWIGLGDDGKKTSSQEYIESLLPTPETTEGKFTSRATRIGTDPINLAVGLFNPIAGVAFPLLGAAGGQIAEEMGYGETGQAVGELTAMGAPALPHLFKLAKKLPQFGKWLKTLSKDGKARVVAGELAPSDLSPSEYFTLENEVMPALNAEFESGLAEQTRLAQEAQQAKSAQATEEAKVASQGNQEEYARKLKEIQTEHEIQMGRIEQENAQAQEAYQKQVEQFQEYSARQKAVSESVQDIFQDMSKNKVIDPYRQGELGSRIIQRSAQFDRAKVNQAFTTSRELNSGQVSIRPQLAHEYSRQLKDLMRQSGGEDMAKLSAPQKRKVNFLQSALNDLAELDESGTIVGYKEVDNQTLFDWGQNLRQDMDFEFQHGNTKGIYTPTLNAIDESVEALAIETGNDAGYQANRQARDLHKEWVKTYDNDQVNKFRSRDNTKYISNVKSITNDVDTYMASKPAFERTNVGANYLKGAKRELVQNKLGSFFKDIHGSDKEAFEKALNELKPVLDKAEYRSIKNTYDAERSAPVASSPKKPDLKKPPEKVDLPKKDKIPEPSMPEFEMTEEGKALIKKLDRTPEDYQAMMKKPRGIRTIKGELQSVEGGEQLFNKLRQHQARRILFGGDIRKDITGKELFDAINRENNFTILAELYGIEDTTKLLDIAQKLGTQSTASKIGKSLIKDASKFKLISLLLL